MSRKLWAIDVIMDRATQDGVFKHRAQFATVVIEALKSTFKRHCDFKFSGVGTDKDLDASVGMYINAIIELSEESNAFDQPAYEVWRTFHINDATEPLGWFFMQETSRAKWVELSKKVSFVKEGSVPIATGWVNQYTPSIKSKSNFDIDRTLLLSYMNMPVKPAIKSLPDRQLDRIRTMPPIVRAMVQEGNAWVVGSQAEFRPEHIKITAESDWDVIVPPSEWQDVMTRLYAAGALKTAEWSSVGGLRVAVPGKKGGTVKLDLWPAEISSHMMKPFTHVAWQPKTGAVWVRLDK